MSDSKIMRYPLHVPEKQQAWLTFQEVIYDVNSNEEDANFLARTRTLGDRVVLYLPGSLEVADSADFGSGETLGTSGAVAAKELNKAIEGPGGLKANAGQAGMNFFDQMAQSIVDNIRAGVGQGGNDLGAIAKVLQQTRFQNTAIGQGVRSAIRRTANPHIRSIFNGVGLRSFNFTFEFMPDSQEEAQIVDDIILFFRKNLYPTFGGEEESDRNKDGSSGNDIGNDSVFDQIAYQWPSMFDIQASYMVEETAPDGTKSQRMRSVLDTGNRKSPFGHKYKTCHLVSATTTYDSGDTMTLRPDGRFPARTLVLGFQEEETLSKRDILAGY